MAPVLFFWEFWVVVVFLVHVVVSFYFENLNDISVGRAQVPEIDVSEVLDFRKIAAEGNSAVAGVSRVEGYDWPVYKIDKQPGK
jgi:hypothetical protein